MTSNQDSNQKDIPIPMTGIDAMNDLSLDAYMMIHLASEGILRPFRPTIHESYMKLLMNCNYDTAIDKVSDWRYRKSDVEAFKLEHREFLEQVRQDKTTSHTESEKHGQPESEYFSNIGKKGGKKSKRNQAILKTVIGYMEDNPKIIDKTNGEIAKKFIKGCDENNAMRVTVDETVWEVYYTGKNIISRVYETHNSKGKNREKSITFNTLRNSYIPKAKECILANHDK